MQAVINTLLNNHDPALVVVAALLCALSSFAGISLLHHARRTGGVMRLVWLGVAAVSVGFGIWATHFVAMLAFHPGIAVGYDLPTTLASLSLAIAIVGGGLWFASVGTSAGDSVLAGAVVGVGISAMHYIGMAAVLVGGAIVWDGNLVAASVLIGMALGAAALWLARTTTWRGRVGAPVLLTLAICAMHFTAMGAAGFAECYAIVAEGTPTWLWLVLSLASTIILGLAMGGTLLDLRDRRHSAESVRMRELADAAVEGIVIVRQGTISATNRSFRQLLGAEADATGRPLLDFLDAAACEALERSPNATLDAELKVAGGAIPVEAVAHEIEFQGVRQRAIAIRDVSSRKQAEEHIRFLAHHDALTGLPNRVSFGRRLNETIDRARSDRQSCSVLCLDLDKFKEVNDLYGHAAERGEVPPGVFVPIAEENGLILGIGEWVLRTACAEAAAWRVPLGISVNVSAAQIHNPAFARLIHEVLVETGLSPGRLEIEVTETALVRDLVRAVTTLRQVRALGVRVAIDDFGTGHSSLTHLSAFPFTRIKLDQSFVRTFDRNPQSAAIVHAVIELGRYLGTPVVAEGVERREELAFLRAEGCATAQGFLFGYPAPISALSGCRCAKRVRLVTGSACFCAG